MTELTLKEIARKGGLATKAKHPDHFKKMAEKRWGKVDLLKHIVEQDDEDARALDRHIFGPGKEEA